MLGFLGQEPSTPYWVQIITQTGGIGALLFVLILLLRGTFRLDREVKGLREDTDKQISELTKDRDFWRNLGLKKLDSDDVVIRTINKVANSLELLTKENKER